MPHSNFLLQKANEFQVDLSKPADQGMLLVYKRTLEGMWRSLRTDLRTITADFLNVLEADLREMYNDFDDMRDTPEAEKFVKSQFMTSVDATTGYIRGAYVAVGVASKMLEDEDNADSYQSFLQAIFNCREALRNALKQFLIKP